jgi:hypothetical protein
MKHEKQNEKMADGQQTQGIQNVPAEKVQITNQGNTFPEIFLILTPPYATRPGSNEGSSTISGHHIGKAPPGRARAPGAARGHPPENKAGPPGQTIQTCLPIRQEPETSPLATCREGPGMSHQTQFFNSNNSIFNTEKTINFINILNFKIMKKQILILALFVLASFASVTNSYGQASAIAPAPGVPYDYDVSVTGASGASSPLYTFWVTKSNNLLTGAVETPGVDFIVNSGATYNIAGAPATINITWTIASVLSATPFYLVVKYTETLNGCTTQNEKVWQIKPVNSFVLAIVPSTATGATIAAVDAHQCVADIIGAVVTPDIVTPANARVAYTYDKNTLYFKATASGMIGSWRPDLQLAANVAGADNQVYTSAQWTTDMTGATGWKTFTGAAGQTPGAAAEFPSANADLAPVTVAGSDILIRVVVDNVNFETLSDQAITAGIDGFLAPALTQSDAISLSNSALEAAYGKTAVYTILKRPTETGTPAFITKAP